MKDGTKTDIKIGLSGCTLKMVDGKIIRKSSHKKSFNNRLNTQVDKQLSFNNIIQSDFHTPQIYKSGVGYFDMEYIPGESYYNFFNNGLLKETTFSKNTFMFTACITSEE